MRVVTALGFVVVLVAMLMVSQMLGLGGGGGSEHNSAELGSRADSVERDVSASLEKARERLTQGIDQAGAE